MEKKQLPYISNMVNFIENLVKSASMADCISKLPDEILSHILSFLPTEDAVATSVLSKRWKQLWLLVPTLDFYDQRYLEGKESISFSSFIDFVHAAILSRDLNQRIKSFTLICDTDECSYSDVEVWLKAAIHHKVEIIKMDFNPMVCASPVPCCILSCKTLVDLNLNSVNFDVFSSVELPSLKTLYLENVEISKPKFLMDLLYGCPVLEDLKIYHMSFADYSPFEGKVKTLSKLVRAEVLSMGGFHVPVKAFSNVQFLRLNECDEDLPVFPNLVYMKLVLGCSIKWSLAVDMLNHCPKLQTVVFYIDFPDVDDEVWSAPSFVPECFSSHLKKCFLVEFTGVESQMRFAKYVMQNSTSLSTMTILKCFYKDQREPEVIAELNSCPRISANCELLFEN